MKTPHELLFGLNPQIDISLQNDTSLTAQKRLQKLQEEAQKLLESQSIATREPHVFKIGEKVWLEAQNLSMQSPSRKLGLKRYGPFPITEKISNMAYQIELPLLMKIHNMFHIDLLTPYQETEAYGQACTRPPPE